LTLSVAARDATKTDQESARIASLFSDSSICWPSTDRTASELATKYSYALLRDATTNAFRELWPDIAVHVLHRNP
jgi:hypothetical protein